MAAEETVSAVPLCPLVLEALEASRLSSCSLRLLQVWPPFFSRGTCSTNSLAFLCSKAERLVLLLARGCPPTSTRSLAV
jgi:hypothetical protein